MLKIASLSSLLTAAISWLAVVCHGETTAQVQLSNQLTRVHDSQILAQNEAHSQVNYRQTRNSNIKYSGGPLEDAATLSSSPLFKSSNYNHYLNQNTDQLYTRPPEPEVLVKIDARTLVDIDERGKNSSHLKPMQPGQFDTMSRHKRQELATAASSIPMPSALISATTVPEAQSSPLSSSSSSPVPTPIPPTLTTTINYSLLMVNGTDPFSISTESRLFSLPTEIQLLMCLLYGTLAFTAIASNMIVCYIVLSNQRMRTPTNYFIVNLAVGDILMALLCIPFTFPANLIFQSWPFGLSLCVIVSYSQANSVFISAYTMVAISIDKYIAIMYPMRPRVPKNQAKIIILVIWSAALVTSLPTALLSSLTPAVLDSGPPQASTITPSLVPTVTVEMMSNAAAAVDNGNANFSTFVESASKTQINSSQSSNTMETAGQFETIVPLLEESRHEKLSTLASDNPSRASLAPSSTPLLPSISNSTLASTVLNQQQRQQQDEYEDEKKIYFCQEIWVFWPGGKYYYSMALMVLQFVVPLFVLVITYTRIVIVVWGKRIPGEEDNARDTRMARSKRKMIKMVIFCVIAFALTWLPFNALIVIGDMNPAIWEHQNIMYIWFITHYLAMCHTITNPLIYIWMNNRFRAGFKHVIGTMCYGTRACTAYLVYYCLCLGCCFACSREKHARLALSMSQKRASQASSPTGNAHNYTNNYQHQHHHYRHPHNANHNNTTSRSFIDHTDRHYLTSTSGRRPAPLARPSSTECRGTMYLDTKGANNNNLSRISASLEPGGQNSGVPAPQAASVAELSTIAARCLASLGGDAAAAHNPPDSSQPIVSRRISWPGTIVITHQEQDKLTATSAGDDDLGGESDQQAAAAAKAMAASQQELARRVRIFSRLRRGDQQALGSSAGKPRSGQQADQVQNGAPSELSGGGGGGRPAVKKKRRKKRVHKINLQMTTCESYGPDWNNFAFMARPRLRLDETPATKLEALAVGKQSDLNRQLGGSCSSKTTESDKFVSKTDCPSCCKGAADFNRTGRHYVVEMSNQSSQSTCSISAQTNNTSLTMSLLNSNGGGGGGGEQVKSQQGAELEAAEARDGNNTSGSLWAIELCGSSMSAAEHRKQTSPTNCSLPDTTRDRDGDGRARAKSCAGGEQLEGDAHRQGGEEQPIVTVEARLYTPASDDLIDGDFDEISPARLYGSLMFDQQQDNNNNNNNNNTCSGFSALLKTETRNSPSGALRSAISLEGHQFASNQVPTSQRGDSIAAHPLPLTWRSSGGQRAAAVGHFCLHHRQTVSAADHCHLLASDCDNDSENEDADSLGTDDDVRDNSLSNNNTNNNNPIQSQSHSVSADTRNKADQHTKRTYATGSAQLELNGELSANGGLLGQHDQRYDEDDDDGKIISEPINAAAAGSLLPKDGDYSDSDNDNVDADVDVDGEEQHCDDEAENLLAEYGDLPRRRGSDGKFALEMRPISSSNKGEGSKQPRQRQAKSSLSYSALMIGQQPKLNGYKTISQIGSGQRLDANDATGSNLNAMLKSLALSSRFVEMPEPDDRMV